MTDEIFCRLKKGSSNCQLICFPYLGGYANVFTNLARCFDRDIDIWSMSLPGHGASKERPLEHIDQVVDHCFAQFKSIVNAESVLFGHSMGGIIAFHLLHRLQKEMSDIVSNKLILSACNSIEACQSRRYSMFTDSVLFEHMKSYGAIDGELMHADDLLQYFLPIFRADFKILESHSRETLDKLNCQVYFLWGEKDPIVPLESVFEWRKYFNRELILIPIANAKHMFINDSHKQIKFHIENIIDSNKSLV